MNCKALLKGKRFLWAALAAAFVAVIVFTAAACKKNKNDAGVPDPGPSGPVVADITAEFGEEFDFTGLLKKDAESLGGNELFTQVKLYAPDNSVLPVANGKFFADVWGVYKLQHRDGTVTEIKTADTKGPAIQVFGGFNETLKGAEVTLPAVRAVDSKDGVIAEVIVSVTYGTQALAVSNGKFTVASSGEYTVKFSAVDKSGNVGERSYTFPVVPQVDFVLPLGTSVTVGDAIFDGGLEGYGEPSYTVTKVIGVEKTTVSGLTFTIEPYAYYEVAASAVNNSDPDDVKKGYALYRSPELVMLTGDGNAGGYGFAVAKSEKTADGQYRYVYSGVTTVERPDIFFTPPGWTQNGIDCTVYMDVHFEGADLGKWIIHHSVGDANIMSFNGGNTTRIAWRSVANPANGPVWLKAFQANVWDAGVWTDTRMIIDNVVFVPNTPPALTAASTQIALESGTQNLALTAEAFGLSATDVFGAPVTSFAFTQFDHFAGGDTTSLLGQVSFGDTIPSVADGVYTVTVRATDKWGKYSDVTIAVAVGDEDYFAPDITAQTPDLAKAAGQVVALSPSGLNLTVTDNVGVTSTTYTVYKNLGAGVAARTSVFTNATSGNITVEAGYYYEVYITAKDAANNSSNEYVLIRDSELAMLSGTGGGAYGMTLSRESDAGGNTRYVFTNVTHAQGKPDIFFAPPGWTQNGVSCTVYMDVHFEGTVTGNPWILQYVNSDPAIMRFNGGATARIAWPSVANPANGPVWLRAYSVNIWDNLWAGDLKMIIDNVVFIPNTPPSITAAQTTVALPSGATNVPLTATGLGLSATDVFGAPVTNFAFTQFDHFAGDDTTSLLGQVSFGDTIPSVADGVYTVTVRATDKWGNYSDVVLTVTVGDADYFAPDITAQTPDSAKAAGSVVALSPGGLNLTITDNVAVTSTTYTVYKNLGAGVAAKTSVFTNVTSGDITVEAGYYYEVYITATDAAGNSATKYVLIRDSALDMLAGSVGSMGTAGISGAVDTDVNGNSRYVFTRVTQSGGHPDILFTPSGWTVNGTLCTAYMDVHFEGTDTGNTWIIAPPAVGQMKFNGGATTRIAWASESSGDSPVRLRPEVANVWDGVWNGDLKMIIDNVVFVPAALPSLTAAQPQIVLPTGTSNLALTAANFGLTATDAFGAAITNYSFTQFDHFAGGPVTDLLTVQGIEFGDTISGAVPDGVYTVTVRATDKWGRYADVTVEVAVGDTDYLAPVVTVASNDLAKAADDVVTLSPEGLGLTVTDNVAVTSTTYTVYKTLGAGTALRSLIDTSGGAFTVESGYFYEVYITATDAAGNNSPTKYILIRDSALHMLSGTGGLTNTYRIAGTTDTLADGNARYVFTNLVHDKPEIFFTPPGWTVQGENCTVYMDIHFEGESVGGWLFQAMNTHSAISFNSGNTTRIAWNSTAIANGAPVWLKVYQANIWDNNWPSVQMIIDNIVFVRNA